MAEPLTWQSSSAAEDLLFRALCDALAALEASGADPHAVVIIGGVMVELLVRDRTMQMSRATKDVDLGIHVLELSRVPLVSELESRDYERRHGHMFVKPSAAPAGESSIDVLVPAYTTKQSRSREVGVVVTIEVGMLAEAIATATDHAVRLVETNGAQTDVVVPVPHPLAALALKLSAWEARRARKDALDVWRCLEVCAHDRLDKTSWPALPDLRTSAERTWRRAFGTLTSEGVVAAVSYASLTGDAATRRAARMVFLGNAIFGKSDTNV
jgi:hypothetical protein